MISSGPLSGDQKPCTVNVGLPCPSSNHKKLQKIELTFGCAAESGRGAVTPALCLQCGPYAWSLPACSDPEILRANGSGAVY
jgi:hypothetical protein